MNDATPTNAPAPMFAVEPVLSFRASCDCGWFRILGTEDQAIGVLTRHVVDTRCDGCADEVDHDAVSALPNNGRVGSYCPECAPSYMAA